MPRGGARPGAGRKPTRPEAAASAPPLPPPAPAAEAGSVRPIGSAPRDLNEGARRAWRELVASARPGTLDARHRPWLEQVAALLARLREDDYRAAPADQARLQAALQRLGLVP